MVRILYRTQQFWNVLSANPLEDEVIEQIRAVLSKREMGLFLQLQTSEQRHSYQVYRSLLERGIQNDDLLKAALMHDIGKVRHPLRIFDRVLIVLGKTIFPRVIDRWGHENHSDWRRIFSVAVNHPAWGAEMAAQAGSSPRTVDLIRRHQDMQGNLAADDKDLLLSHLQSADDNL